MRILPSALAAVLVAGCAQKPDNIAAVDIGPSSYATSSCAQLAEYRQQYGQALRDLSAQQIRAAQGDAWGVLILGVPVSSMSGKDKETAIAMTKGHLQAIEAEQARKTCRPA